MHFFRPKTRRLRVRNPDARARVCVEGSFVKLYRAKGSQCDRDNRAMTIHGNLIDHAIHVVANFLPWPNGISYTA